MGVITGTGEVAAGAEVPAGSTGAGVGSGRVRLSYRVSR